MKWIGRKRERELQRWRNLYLSRGEGGLRHLLGFLNLPSISADSFSTLSSAAAKSNTSNRLRCWLALQLILTPLFNSPNKINSKMIISRFSTEYKKILNLIIKNKKLQFRHSLYVVYPFWSHSRKSDIILFWHVKIMLHLIFVNINDQNEWNK